MHYHFSSLNGIQILKRGLIRFHTFEDRKNPFEQNQKLLSSATENIRVSEQDYQQELRRQYEGLEDHLKAMISFDYFTQQAVQKKEEILTELKTKTRLDKNLPNEKQYQQLVSLSLYQTALNPMLWLYRGHRYQGMAIGLNTDTDYFLDGHYRSGPQSFKTVIYQDGRPDEIAGPQPFPALFHQPIMFAHEQESRLVRLKTQADKQELEDYLFNLPSDLVKEIVFGPYSPETETKKVCQYLHMDTRYKQLTFKRIALDPNTFDLHLEDYEL